MGVGLDVEGRLLNADCCGIVFGKGKLVLSSRPVAFDGTYVRPARAVNVCWILSGRDTEN